MSGEIKTTFSDSIETHAAWIFEKIFIPKLNAMSMPLEVHGLLHASRVAHYIPMLYRLYRGIDPSLPELTLDEIKAAQLAGLFHDMAREDDGVDHWDLQSAEMAYHYLANSVEELSEGMAEFVANIAANKDSRELGSSHKIQVNQVKTDADTSKISFQKTENNSPDFEKTVKQQFLESLLHDADCLDIMRCHQRFDTKYLHLSKYPGMSPEYLGWLRNAVFQLIHLEKDQSWKGSSQDIAYIRNPACFIEVAKDIQKIPVLKLLTLPLPRIIPKQLLGELREAYYDNPIQFEYESQGLLVRAIGTEVTYSTALKEIRFDDPRTYLDIELEFASQTGGNKNRCASLLVPGLIPARPLCFLLTPHKTPIHFLSLEDADTGWGSRHTSLVTAVFKRSSLPDQSAILSLEDLRESGLKTFPSYRHDPNAEFRHTEVHLDYDLSVVSGVIYSTEHVSSKLTPAECFIRKLEAIVAATKIKEKIGRDLKIYEYQGVSEKIIEKPPETLSIYSLNEEAKSILQEASKSASTVRNTNFFLTLPIKLNENLQRYFPELHTYVSKIWCELHQEKLKNFLSQLYQRNPYYGIYPSAIEYVLNQFNQVLKIYDHLDSALKEFVFLGVQKLITAPTRRNNISFLSHYNFKELLEAAKLKKCQFFKDFNTQMHQYFNSTLDLIEKNPQALGVEEALNLIEWFDEVKNHIGPELTLKFEDIMYAWFNQTLKKEGIGWESLPKKIETLLKVFPEEWIGSFIAKNLSFRVNSHSYLLKDILMYAPTDKTIFFTHLLTCFDFSTKNSLRSVLEDNNDAGFSYTQHWDLPDHTSFVIRSLKTSQKLLFILAQSERVTPAYIQEEIVSFLSDSKIPVHLKNLISLWTLPLSGSFAELHMIQRAITAHAQKFYLEPSMLANFIWRPKEAKNLLNLLKLIEKKQPGTTKFVNEKMTRFLKLVWVKENLSLEKKCHHVIELLNSPLMGDESPLLLTEDTELTELIQGIFKAAFDQAKEKKSLPAFKRMLDLIPDQLKKYLPKFDSDSVKTAQLFSTVSSDSAASARDPLDNLSLSSNEHFN